MNDKRKALESGSTLNYNSLKFKITGLLGKGGNSLVYTAEYEDSVVKKGVHRCVIKELFPFHPDGMIYRDEGGKIVVEEGAEDFYSVHKKSFMYGNTAHMDILRESPDSVGMNFDSFEYGGTFYTILSLNALPNLKERLGEFSEPEKAAQFLIRLLKAVGTFHKSGILHLDISPDNIIITDSNSEYRILIIDFNSCYYIDADNERESYFSINPDYSAPELKINGIGRFSAAADIYSCVLVFIYILTGSVFKFTRGNLNRLLRNKNIEPLPQPAKQLLGRIIVKALRTDPKLRYTTTEALISDVRELIDRINNAGVTHGSVWEASRKLCDEFKEDIFENRVLWGEKLILPEELPKTGSCILKGEGGIGKTTLLKRLWSEGTKAYNPGAPAVFYVPLYRFDGKAGFIRRYIVSKLNFNEEVSTIDDGIKRLNDIMTGDKGGIYLLLDGYNEISGSTEELINEIKEINGFSGASVIISTRKEVPEGLEDFPVCRLMAFDSEVVKKSLNKKGLAYPEAEDLRELLKNPLMLKLYIKSREVYKESVDYDREVHNASDIIHGYVNSFCESFKNISPGDKNGLIRLSYILEILFPAFCAEADKKRLITFERAKKICKREYKRLKSGAFSRAFKKYSGRARDILEETESFDEWMHLAVNGILINDTALITEDSGVYNILHMNFAPCLGEDYKKLRRRYFKAAAGVRVPVCLVCALICSAAFSAGYYYAPGTHPIGKIETAANNTLMSLIQMETMYMTQMLTEENEVIKAMNSGGRSQALGVLYSTKEYFYRPEKYIIEAKPEDYLYFGLDSEAVEKYFQTAYDHCLWAADFYDRLEYALGEDSRYSDKQLDEAFDNYEEYLTTLKKIEAYRLCQIEKSINKNSTGEIEKLKKTDLFLMEYSAETASLDGNELSALLDGNTGLCRKLEQVGLKLNFIRGAEI